MRRFAWRSAARGSDPEESQSRGSYTTETQCGIAATQTHITTDFTDDADQDPPIRIPFQSVEARSSAVEIRAGWGIGSAADMAVRAPARFRAIALLRHGGKQNTFELRRRPCILAACEFRHHFSLRHAC